MSSTRCQPLLKHSGPRNRLASPQIRDHLPYTPRSILHSHFFLFNPHTPPPTTRRTQNLSTFPPTSSVTSYSYPPYAQDSTPENITSPKACTHNAKHVCNHKHLIPRCIHCHWNSPWPPLYWPRSDHDIRA